MQNLDCNFCEFIINNDYSQSENLLKCLKFYYNIILSIEYLKKLDLRVEDLNLSDIYIDIGK